MSAKTAMSVKYPAMSRTLKTALRWVGYCVALLGCATAFAHTPVCRCELSGEQVVCEGGYHDGSKAAGITMVVLGYNGDTLANGQLDAASRFHFELPAVPFYVLMDAGPGEMFEIDWSDIPGMDKQRFRAD